MKTLRLLALVVFVVAFATTSYATVVMNTAGDGFEDRSDGSVFGYYQNSGTLLFTEAGNNLGSAANLLAVQTKLNSISGFGSIILAITDNVSYTPYDANSGTWATVPPIGTIDFYAVKAGDYYAFYEVNPADSIGSWSTFDIWAIGGPGTGGHPQNGGGDLGISHFTGYNPGTSVPEPSMLMLFGSGLVGLGLLGRKKIGK